MSDRFEISSTPISDLFVIQRNPIGDSRGYLERLYCVHELAEVNGSEQIVQINHTLTSIQGAVRGLHFQNPPHAEMKLVTCLRGTVFDVAVDLRSGSSTFLQWHSELLSGDNHRTLVMPKGFAHGFQTLSDDCEMLYLHTNKYEPSAEGALNATDPRLAIQWPQTITDRSSRDEGHPLLTEEFVGLDV